ncbi:hypothetical protein P4H65_20580 [Paenibacillus chitinolyticus]|uniref:hypothetical protein n=1 Tax=Paenibacillus chitinolyticus TaxID=79263 RepID=UPI002DBEF679|nr:hypothetical protein [Paenibacillus chitinolyticus]MEC0248197.1 hypothetical protein [Paenibacillus chitinolyticus]
MHSFTYESKDSNNNSEEILGLLQFYTNLSRNVSWLIGDLELVPLYLGDYHPTGKPEPQRISLTMIQKFQEEGFLRLSLKEIEEMLNDSLSVHRAVFVCLPEHVEVSHFHGDAESLSLQHESALHEITVLDDLIIINSAFKLRPSMMSGE